MIPKPLARAKFNTSRCSETEPSTDGWIATARHGRLPWVTAGGTTGDFDHDKWELYNLADDFSEANDVSAQYPQKLKELQDDFLDRGEKV
jgi:arylsulfatase A-like enzyme